MIQPDKADAELASSLRLIRTVAIAAGALWMVLAIIGTVLISSRVLSSYLAEAADDAARDTHAISVVVNRMFHELEVIPRIMSYNRELRAIVSRYNATTLGFFRLSEAERAGILKGDLQVALSNQRLTTIRNELNYDLIYVLDSSGIR